MGEIKIDGAVVGYLQPGRRSSPIMRCVVSTINSVTGKYTVIRRTKINTEREKTAIPTFA